MNMNYYKIYKQLINKRISNPIDPTIVKCQKHHIKPKSCGENDDFLLIIVDYKKKLNFLKKVEKKALPFC